MDTATVETPTTAQVEAPAAVETPSSDAPSIADHAKAFSPEAQAAAVEKDDEGSDINRPRDESGKFSRQRAESHRAKPDDVPRIKELTKKWREEERQRKELSDRYAALEKEVQALKTPKPVEAPKPFDGKEPTFEQFQNDPDPLAAYTKAVSAHIHDQKQAEQASKAHETAQQQQMQARIQSLQAAHVERVQAMKAKTPDWDAVIASASKDDLPDVLKLALLEDDRSGEFVYALAKRPEFLSEAILVSDGRAVTESNVAHMRRLLASRMTGALTGSPVAVQPSYSPPKPPNPGRTGTIKTTDEPPDEATSIAEHARYYGRSR